MLLQIALLLGVNAFAATRTVAIFNTASYEGWTYTRSNIELNNNSITQHQIGLRGDYKLISPQLDCSGLDSLHVTVEYWTGKSNYTASKLAMNFTLTDVASNSSITTTTQAKAGQASQDMIAKMPVVGNDVTITLSAPNADVNNFGAVIQVVITGTSNEAIAGDVNNDGIVDITDVNKAINAILGKVEETDCDVNNDGIVDVTDVNAIVNIVLSK